MPKAVGWMALAYVGYLVVWFVFLVVGALVFGQGSLASAERGVALVLLGTLLLAAGCLVLGVVAARRTAPAGTGRTILLLAFAALVASTLLLQGVVTLVAFNR